MNDPSSNVLEESIPGTGKSCTNTLKQKHPGVFEFFSFFFPLVNRLPRWLSGKELVGRAGDTGSLPGSGRSPREGNGKPLQCSCLRNPRDRGDWWATVLEVAKSLMT